MDTVYGFQCKYTMNSKVNLFYVLFVQEGKFSNLDNIIEYYKGRGNIEPINDGLGTSRFQLDNIYSSQLALDLLRVSINTGHNFNSDMSAWAAVSALALLPDNALPYVMLCKSLAWNPGFLLAWRQCIKVASEISTRHGASRQEILYTNVSELQTFKRICSYAYFAD